MSFKALRSLILTALAGAVVLIALPWNPAQAQTTAPSSQTTVTVTPAQLDVLANVVTRYKRYFSSPSFTFTGPTTDAPRGLVNLTLTVTLPVRVPKPKATGTQQATTGSTTTTTTSMSATVLSTVSYNTTLTFKPNLLFGALTWTLTNVTVNGQQPTAAQLRTIRSLARVGLLPAWARAIRNAYFTALRGWRITNVAITPASLTITAQRRVRIAAAKATPAATSAR